MQIVDSTILVTGAGSGLGEACVRHFEQRGAKVIALDIAAAPAAEAAADRVLRVVADVTHAAQVSTAIQLGVARFGALHAVINCAGVLGASRMITKEGPHDLDLFRRVIEVNLIGTFNVMRLAAERMSMNEPNADGERGVVVNTSSVSAFEGQIGQAAYAASKGGVASMTLPCARDLARHGIRVVAVAPGVFHTPMIDAAPVKVQESLRGQTVFPPRLGNPLEFARFAQHIIENPMLNGSILRLDGAQRLREM